MVDPLEISTLFIKDAQGSTARDTVDVSFVRTEVRPVFSLSVLLIL